MKGVLGSVVKWDFEIECRKILNHLRPDRAALQSVSNLLL